MWIVNTSITGQNTVATRPQPSCSPCPRPHLLLPLALGWIQLHRPRAQAGVFSLSWAQGPWPNTVLLVRRPGEQLRGLSSEGWGPPTPAPEPGHPSGPEEVAKTRPHGDSAPALWCLLQPTDQDGTPHPHGAAMWDWASHFTYFSEPQDPHLKIWGCSGSPHPQIVEWRLNKTMHLKAQDLGTSLVVQWLRLCAQRRGCKFDPWSGN